MPSGKRKKSEAKVDPAATDNLIGFFALLLEIDMRNNPQLYGLQEPVKKDA